MTKEEITITIDFKDLCKSKSLLSYSLKRFKEELKEQPPTKLSLISADDNMIKEFNDGVCEWIGELGYKELRFKMDIINECYIYKISK